MFRLFATTSAFALLATAAGGAQAQETAQLEEVVVVGSRATARLVTDSPAPVDVISAETLAAQGFDDINPKYQLSSTYAHILFLKKYLLHSSRR